MCSRINYIRGNLLDATEDAIVHQGNCVTQKAAHLAYSVFTRFPHANVYGCRQGYQDTVGTAVIRGNGKAEKYVITLFGQRYPGKSKYSNDTQEMRYKWFQEGLEATAKLMAQYNLKTLAFPARIGCGAAGGNWELYLQALISFGMIYLKILLSVRDIK